MKHNLLSFIGALLLTTGGCHNAPSGPPETTKQLSETKPRNNTPVAKPDSGGRRFGMVTGIRPEKITYYKQLHAKVWPGVSRQIKACNISNYSIYLQQLEGKYFLFSYFEYTGHDFEADMRRMASDSITRLWWKETAPAQLPLPQAAARKDVWTTMEEVFHQD